MSSQPRSASAAGTFSKTDVMFKSALQDDLQNLQLLLDGADGEFESKESNIFVTDSEGLNLLHWAVQGCSGDSCIQFLLLTAPQLATQGCSEGNTPLLHACYSRRAEKDRVQLMLSDALVRTTVNKPNLRGNTPLHAVVERYDIQDDPNSKQDAVAKKKRKRHYLSMARLLIESGADVNAENLEGLSPLLIAINHEKLRKADMEMIELLVNFGAKFCTKSGTNSLILASNSSFLTHYILQEDCSGINLPDSNGLTPLHHAIQNNEGCVINLLISHGAKTDSNCISLARQCKISLDTILYLLKRSQPYDINTKDKDGKTLLIQYSNDLANIERLLDLGADVKITSNDGSNALFTVVQQPELKVDIAVALIRAGADPLIVDEKGRNIISYVCERFVTDIPESGSFSLLEYLLNLPQFNGNSSKVTKALLDLDPATHPQKLILSNLHTHHEEDQIFKILNLLVKSNLKDPSQVINVFNGAFNYNTRHIFKPLRVGPISCLFNTSRSYLSENIKTCLNLMLKSGFSIRDTPAGTITPLTILLGAKRVPAFVSMSFHINDDEEMNYNGMPFDEFLETEVQSEQSNDAVETLIMVKKLIEEGVNVEDMSLKVMVKRDSSPPGYQSIRSSHHMRQLLRLEGSKKVFDPALESLRRQLWLPDALWMAFLTDKKDVAQILLPHWSAPPLALLLFISYPGFKVDMKGWFPLLYKFGAVPHGSKACKRLTILFNMNREQLHSLCFLDFESYTEVMRSPLSLRELSRYAVRAAVAAKASQPGNSLPDLLASICPPGLKDYLLMKSREQPCATQVGDKKRIRSFQFIYSCSI